MAGTKAGAKKALKTRLAKDPAVFSKMGKINPGPGKKFNSATASKAGALSKRPKVKTYKPSDKPLATVKLDDVKIDLLEEPANISTPVQNPGDK